MDEIFKTFVVYVASLNLGIYIDREAQIAFLLIKEIKILEEYSDFTNVFSEEKAFVLLERIELNKHTINLDNCKQPPYRPIYSLSLLELETLKTYIETHLKTGFIWSSKFPTGALILFDKKPDASLRLYIDYWGFNNLTINNLYLLPLIEELLDRLGQATRFNQLDLINAYHQMRITEVDKWKTAFRTRYSHFEY